MKIDRNYIASKAGVSSATISRVFNDPALVSPEKIEAVLSLSKKYGYTPNKMASALRRKDTGIIAFVENSPKEGGAVGRNFSWTYAFSIKGSQSVIENSMYQMNLVTISSENADNFFNKKQCDGIITYNLNQKYYKRLKDSKIPYVICYREESEDLNVVYIDELYGGFLAGELFKSTGHKKFAHITAGLKTDLTSAERYEGFKKAIGGEPLLLEGEYGIKGGFDMGMIIAEEVKAKNIDAIFVLNDLTSFGVIHALSAKGIKIPEDVSIIGYDNMPYSESISFKLTTIELPMFETFKIAAEALMNLIKNGGKVRTAVKPVLIKGDTVLDRS